MNDRKIDANQLVQFGLVLVGAYVLIKALRGDFKVHRCGNCNAVLLPNAKVCARCGYAIEWRRVDG